MLFRIVSYSVARYLCMNSKQVRSNQVPVVKNKKLLLNQLQKI